MRTLTGFSASKGVEGQIDVPTVLGWIERAIAALQCPVTSPNYFSGIAQTIAGIIDLDRAEIILWDGEHWEFSDARRYVKPGLPYECDPPSVSLLRQALLTKQLAIHPNPNRNTESLSESLVDLHTAIASPILDVLDDGKQILGVLYAARRRTADLQRPATVLEPEQKLVAIVSTAIASSVARMKREGLVTKYQQFFSPKVTQAISQNPGLLEGEDADVSVLFCDIRGFSKVADAIGAKAAMSWVSDTLSDLSAIVLESDGVLVDYVGDEMFAMWGAPEKSFEHAFRASMAAQAMMGMRRTLNERYAGKLPSKIDFGIGVCTGPARVGNTGSRQKFKYGPMGRTVNMGSRIQGLTKQWGVSTILDETTVSYLPSDMPIRRLCRARVVGMDGDIGLHELMADGDANPELIAGYAQALALYESGQNFREAARAFGELVQRFPTDGPSLIMLVRAVNELVTPSPQFSPIWTATNK
jgi:adenylate cyclase